MDFLLDNPLALMDGYIFLVVLGVAILFSILTVAAVRTISGTSNLSTIPAIPPNPDPFEVAYLRGGENEATRSVIFSLLQKELVSIESVGKSATLRSKVYSGSAANLTPVEHTSINWIGSGRDADEVFKKRTGLVEKLEPYFDAYRGRLENQELITSRDTSARVRRVARYAASLVILLGGYKVLASLYYGHFNLIFTLITVAVGSTIIIAIGKMPRITQRGKQYLERLYLAFEDLKFKSQAPYLRNSETAGAPAASFAGVDPLLLSVGVFGSGILAGTVFDDYNTAFRKAEQQQATSSSGCGSGCGSSCSSGSDGGGSSCGGGCGGGGCGS